MTIGIGTILYWAGSVLIGAICGHFEIPLWVGIVFNALAGILLLAAHLI